MFKKVSNFLKGKSKKIISICLSLCLVLCMSAICFASETSTTTNTITASDFSPIITAFQSAITPQMLISILATCAVVGIGFVAMWFGYGKIKAAFTRAFKKGKL